MNTRATWRNFHFSRRLGEQVPDATHACAIEGHKPGRIRTALCWGAAIALPFLAYWSLK